MQLSLQSVAIAFVRVFNSIKYQYQTNQLWPVYRQILLRPHRESHHYLPGFAVLVYLSLASSLR